MFVLCQRVAVHRAWTERSSSGFVPSACSALCLCLGIIRNQLLIRDSEGLQDKLRRPEGTKHVTRPG